MRFQMGGVKLERWEEKKERLGRFFAKGLQAELRFQSKDELDLMILPKGQQDDPAIHQLKPQ